MSWVVWLRSSSWASSQAEESIDFEPAHDRQGLIGIQQSTATETCLGRSAGAVTRGENCDARWPGSPHGAKRPHASHAPLTALRPKAILRENLEKAFVRRFSISIPNLLMANTPTSSGRENTIWRSRAAEPTLSQ